LSVFVIAILYFFQIQVFGAGLYHYVPAAKGGGDLSQGRIVLRWRLSAEKALPSALLRSHSSSYLSRKLVLIEASPSTIYVADPRTRGGPTNWRTSSQNRPSV